VLSVFQNYALALEISSAKILSSEDCGLHLQYSYNGGWSYVTTHYQYYVDNGIEYPAYCLNRDRDGATEAGSYTVDVESAMSDVRIWRVVINGYPYKTPAQMGVDTWQDAYVATKQAVYSILYDRDVKTFYNGGDARGIKIVAAIDKMVTEGRNGTITPQSANLTINKVGALTDDGNYYSQTYKVSSIVNINNYTITGTSNMPSGGLLTNMSNVAQTTFASGDNFKILIPKNQLVKNISVTVKIDAQCETYPVFFGDSKSTNLQNYALAFSPYTTENSETTLDIAGNTASLQITKIDSDTKQPMQGVKFEVFQSTGESIGVYETDKNGVITINNLYPGVVKIKEVETGQDYVLNTEESEATLEWGKTTNLQIGNAHKKGSIEVIKVDKDDNNILLEGVEFQLLDEKGNVVDTKTTDKDGKVSFSNINIGNYIIRETKTQEQYNLALVTDTNITVEWNQDSKIMIENEKKKGQIEVYKLSEDDNKYTNLPANSPLPGTVFELYDEAGNLLETLTTDENRTCYFKRISIRKILY